jgi:hypothetical protein
MNYFKYVVVLLSMFLFSNAISQKNENDSWQDKLKVIEETGDLLAVLDYLEELNAAEIDTSGQVSLKLEVYAELVDELLFEEVNENKSEEEPNFNDVEENYLDHSLSILSSYDFDDSKYSSRLWGAELGYSLGYSFEGMGSYHMLGASLIGELLKGETFDSEGESSNSQQWSNSYSLSYTLLSGNWVWMSLLDYSNWDDQASTDTDQVKAFMFFQSISQDFLKGEYWKGTWNVYGNYSPDFDDEIGIGVSANYNSNKNRWKLGTQLKRSFSDRVSYEIKSGEESQSNLDSTSMILNIEEWFTINPYISWKYKLGEKHILRAKMSLDIEDLVEKDKYLKYVDGEVVWSGSTVKADTAYYTYETGEVMVYAIDGNEYQKSVKVIDWYFRIGYDYLFGQGGDLGSLEFRFKYEGQNAWYESKSNPKGNQTRFYGSIGYSVDF